MKSSKACSFEAVELVVFHTVYLLCILLLQPPVIRLYDLMVRTNASVKSGVQLLLVEQSSTPEMYKLDFADKKKAKE